MDKVIALDIGKVCVNLRFDLCRKALGYDDLVEPPAALVRLCAKFETGDCSVEHWLKVFHRITKNQFTDDQIFEAWNLIIGDEIEGMSELIREIIALGFRFVFFSDSNEPHIMHCYRNLSFAHLVSGHIYSYEVGAQKPSDAMYEAFEAEYGKPFFYLDDKECNVEGGRKHGWESHLFTTADHFRDEFFAYYTEQSDC